MTTKRILFANVPLDGHFNPLTGLAIHLKNAGYDIAWYTGRTYKERVEKHGIHFFPFKKAVEVCQDTLEEVFFERRNHRGQISKLKFDLKNFFVLRSPEYYQDICKINEEWPFDLMICDVAFSAIPLVKDAMKKPVISIGIVPLTETSEDLPPAGLGLTPSKTWLGKLIQHGLRFFVNKFVFHDSKKTFDKILSTHGVSPEKGNIFDVMMRKSTLMLQIGTRGFEYKRSDIGPNIRFIGPVTHQSHNSHPITHDLLSKIKSFSKVILVTQGTVEKDTSKIIVPVLEAFKNSNNLVIATTGGSGTKELKDKYPQPNIFIDDFIPFTSVMPHVHAYVTNGGFGGVMLGIQNHLPLVVAGVHEGKNEICARVGYFKLGINLKTERPSPQKVKMAVQEVLENPSYKINVLKMAREFKQYNSTLICEKYVENIIGKPVDPLRRTFEVNNELPLTCK